MSQATKKRGLSKRPKQAKILVIEDNRDHWNLIEKAMKECFVEVEPVWAENSQQALAYLEDCLLVGQGLPLFILLDLYLPEREDGWKLLEQIRSKKTPIDLLPIVVLSSSVYDEDITESYDRGITSYLVKPSDFKDWISSFQALKEYWVDTVALPDLNYRY
ncbi:response regulator [Larkinella knui]|uniref:Response regulator n=1 Tax=Larkinella knui TaxID=2025310 RepID=A0A3P1CXV9_9BACT|nr:response regulator [Larkinella knui]RRB18155.1 response regulator [Larkinella knui]